MESLVNVELGGGQRLLYSAEQAAEITSLSRSTIFQLIRDGRIRSVSVGRARRIPFEALRDFVESLIAEEGA